MRKILVFGDSGQLGLALKKVLPADTVFVSEQQADFTKLAVVRQKLDEVQPNVVINTAAYTAVDLAEKERDLCRQVNADAPAAIASWCAKNSSLMIHFSTDYVFNGSGEDPWRETDTPGPLNWYGECKLQGDRGVANSKSPHLIFRVSWIYSDHGKNFVKTMLRLGSEKEELKIVDDQIGYPTLAEDLAKAVARVLSIVAEKNFVRWGVYHLTGPEPTSWFDFAQAIFAGAKKMGFPIQLKRALPIKSAEYPTPAVRPLNSRLNGAKFHEAFGFWLPPWQESLKLCLNRIQHEGSKSRN